MIRIVTVIAILIVGNNCIYCKANVIDHQSAAWTRATVKLQFKKDYFFHAEIDERFFLSNFSQFQFVHRSIVGKQFNKRFEGSLCYVLSLNRSSSPEKKTLFAVPENRPHQDLIIRQFPAKKIQFQHRIRLDERFIRNSNKTELLPGHFFIFRPRYQFSVSFLLWKNDRKNDISLLLSEETFIHFGKSIQKYFDQQRFAAGLKFGFNHGMSITVSYMNQLQRNQKGNVLTDRHNLLLNYTINIDCLKKSN
jgi:hypothetical protein